MKKKKKKVAETPVSDAKPKKARKAAPETPEKETNVSSTPADEPSKSGEVSFAMERQVDAW